MLPLRSIRDKTAQIQELRLVSTAAVIACRTLKEEVKCIRYFSPYMGRTGQQRGGGLNHYESDTQNIQGDVYYSSQSQAEITLYWYSDRNNSVPPTNSNIHTRRRSNVRMFPFNPEDHSYLNKYELVFRGCFKCGLHKYNSRDRFPYGNNTNQAMMNVF